MATIKATFTLDEPTIARLKTASERLGRPKSQVVREAIHDYADRIGRLSEREREHMLRVFDEMLPRIPERPLGEVEAEIEEIRRSRRRDGRSGRGGSQ